MSDERLTMNSTNMRLLDFVQLFTVNCFSVHRSHFTAASAAYLVERINPNTNLFSVLPYGFVIAMEL